MVAQRNFVLEFPGVRVHVFEVGLFVFGNDIKRVADVDADLFVLRRVVYVVFASEKDAAF